MKNQQLIKRLRAGLKSDETGNKANSLIFLHRYGFNIPLTFLVTIRAHERYLKEGVAVLDELRREVLNLPDKLWAVRSSTTAEDSKEFSFAGQFQTVMNVRGTVEILEAVRSVWDSASLLNDNEYLRRTGISAIRCGVIIQEMIESKLAGVSFSRNPVTNQNEIVIEALEGYGEELVQKGVTPMRWRIRKNAVAEGNPDLPYHHVIEQVAKDTARLRKYYGQHIDIEWAWDGKQLYYLQLRQITGRKELHIYSNKMAKEMLPGQVKPLVWSVNIPLVNGTWIKLLSEITGPLDIIPEELAKPFYYQTYFNVATLGRIFSEFGMSSDSLEQLMISNDNRKPSFTPGIRTARHTFRIIRFLYTKIRFEKRLLDEYHYLTNRYRELERKITDTFSLSTYPEIYSMLFTEGRKAAYLNIVTPILMTMRHKSLRKRLARLGVEYDNLDFSRDFPLLNDYTPAPAMQRIKVAIGSLPEPLRVKCTSLEAMRSVEEASGIVADIDQFIRNFGHLSESGNDLSFAKWEEDPEMVYRMILRTEVAPVRSGLFAFDDIRKGGLKTGTSLHKLYLKAGRFKLYREQISSLYIFGYGLFRRLFLKLARELTARGILKAEDDIFYLRKEEIDALLANPELSEISRCQELIIRRRSEMEATKDIVLPPVIYGDEAPVPQTGRVKNLSGVGTSSGIFTGSTRVVKKAGDFDKVEKGEIILIPFSDVSWTPILVKAGAIVSETGGMLSHCSIIAREMGIPALVSVSNACAIGNGLKVTVDGSNGVLTVHDYE